MLYPYTHCSVIEWQLSEPLNIGYSVASGIVRTENDHCYQQYTIHCLGSNQAKLMYQLNKRYGAEAEKFVILTLYQTSNLSFHQDIQI